MINECFCFPGFSELFYMIITFLGKKLCLYTLLKRHSTSLREAFSNLFQLDRQGMR